MAELTHRASSLLVPSSKTPDTSLSIKVNRKSLRCVIDKGLSKGSWFERHNPLRLSNRVAVEAAEFGTADSVFFVPEQPNVNLTSRRVAPVEYVKVSPYTTADAVSQDDAFEISFVGMSISPQDAAGDNELLLFSLTKEDFLPAESKLNASAHPAPDVSDLSATTASAEQEEDPDKDFIRKVTSVASVAEQNPAIDNKDLGDLPTSITIHPGDHPFIHFDPEVDGHDTGNQPDTFVPIPGSKRVYMQRQPECNNKYGDINMRFTVMEIDKLSEEQLIAIRNLDSIGKSVGKAASAVPYLKVISAILKFANFLGRSALKKVSQPDHVMSKDMAFMLAPGPDRENGNEKMKREEFGNYLRYGYYFFLSSTVDAKLYAQIGASSQNVQLLLKRQGYRAKFALPNEVEYFPLSGVSYVVVKVTRGCAPMPKQDRTDMLQRHRKRLVKLLRKYTGSMAVRHEDSGDLKEVDKGAKV